MIKPGLIATRAVLLMLALPIIAQAEVLTWVMEGTIQNVHFEEPPNWASLGQVGDQVRYSVTFDSDTPGPSIFHAFAGSASIGNALFPVKQPMFRSFTDPPDIFILEGGFEQVGMSGHAEFSLNNYLTGVLDASHLPAEPYPLDAFESAEFSVLFYGPVYPQFRWVSGTIDAFYAVPEPTTLAFFLAASLALATAAGSVFQRRVAPSR